MIAHPNRRAVLAGLGALPAAVTLAEAAPLPTPKVDEIQRRAAALDQLHALVIAQQGEIAFARAFRGAALESPVNVKSVSKTIVATLTGTAIARGEISGVDALLVDFLDPPASADPRVRTITVEDLLTMRAGLERTSGANYGSWVQSSNWVANALARRFVAEPGGRFLYSTGSYHLLGAVLAEATGRSLLTLARERLGAPLEIDVPAWTRDPQGRYLGGNNMRFSPLALVRFGELWRAGGHWRDTPVLEPSWVETSWTARTRSPFSGHDYGYGWFLAMAGPHRVAYARGYGGQMVYVVPDLELTVVVTSDPNRPARSGGYVGDLHNLLADTIIPAIEAA